VDARARKSSGGTHRKGAGAGAASRSVTSRKGTGKGHVKKRGKGAKPSRRELGREVSQELMKLRPILKDIGAALLGRLDGELDGIALSLSGESLHGESAVLPQLPILSAMLAEIKALKLKSKKGRVKDLRRIEVLLESLSARIPAGA
jgi:hypothetical protein